MKVLIVEEKEFSDVAASFFVNQIIRQPYSCVGLAGGNTTLPIHAAIVQWVTKTHLDLSCVHFFNVDEYAGISRFHRGTCWTRMWQQLLSPMNIEESHVHLFNPECADALKECDRICNEINQFGGIDLQFLGIGSNGHVGFNQPDSPFGACARTVDFDEAFIEGKALQFGEKNQVPRLGMTLGLRDCMQCRSIVLVANDVSKSDILPKIIYGPVTERVPASVFQLHPNAILIASRSAAKNL